MNIELDRKGLEIKLLTMKAFKIEVTNWGNCPITFTGNETADKARYSAFKTLQEIHECNFRDIKVTRANVFDKYAKKMKDRFIESDKIQTLFDCI